MHKQTKKRVVDRAKRRVDSQKIGRQGELIFEKWATQNFVNPHKSQEDLGIDYFCERLKPITTRVEEVTGDIFVAQVRATARKNRPCVVLDRTDVTTALRMKHPFCLVAVSLESEEISFRFLDVELFDEWTAFLKTDKKRDRRYVEHMETGRDEFASSLAAVSRPAFRSLLEKRKAQARLEAILPHAAFEVRGGSEGWTLVAVPDLISIFQLESREAREQAAEIFFTPQPFDMTFRTAVRQLRLHEPFEDIRGLALGPMVVVGKSEAPVKVFVELGDERVEADFLLRRIGDERAYIGGSGLVLQISDARKDRAKGAFYHACRSSLSVAGALDLAASGQLPFLKLLRPGARINEVGRLGIDIETFQLQGLGAAVEALAKVFEALNIPLSAARLADFANRDFGTKIGFIDAVLDRTSSEPIVPAFTIGLRASQTIDPGKWRAGKYRLPIALNLSGYGVVLWINGDAVAYVHEGIIHGFRFDTSILETAETLAAEHPNLATGIHAWVYKNWPALPLTDRVAQTLKVRSSDPLPLGGEFLATDEGSDAMRRNEKRT